MPPFLLHSCSGDAAIHPACGLQGGALMRSICAIIVSLISAGLTLSPAFGYRDYFTAEQKAQLARIQTVLVEAIALTDKGSVDSSVIAGLAVRRLSELGYTVVQDSAQPHDVVFRI